jgi:hypothetical protein
MASVISGQRIISTCRFPKFSDQSISVSRLFLVSYWPNVLSFQVPNATGEALGLIGRWLVASLTSAFPRQPEKSASVNMMK